VISPLRFAMTSPHQVVKGTFTLKLSNMLGTHKKPCAGFPDTGLVSLTMTC
jgi:hypothetical protein